MRAAVIILMAGLLVISALVLWRSTQQSVAVADISPEHELVFFSATWCGYCDRARQWFDQQQVNYLEIDVESSTEANRLWREAGGRGVPHVLVGDRKIPGYAPEAYARALSAEAVN